MTAVSTVTLSPASVQRFYELVRVIETSPFRGIEQKRKRKKQRKRLKATMKVAQQTASREKKQAFCMTLTYANSKNFDGKQISKFIDNLRRWLKKEHKTTLTYVWVLERATQLHYHLTIWLPAGVLLDFNRLEKWWRWGSTWVERCRDLNRWSDYISKFNQPETSFKKGTRLYGYGGLDDKAKIDLARAAMPIWLRKVLPLDEHARRAVGGGWVNLNTGERYFSPYKWTSRGIIRV